ncbi:MAG: Ldh family oxidoreductase [Bacteroidota bacterium]|nr:Ldh family oxidoreductase [Bacteroidota bacterium]
MEEIIIPSEKLHRFVVQVFEHVGFSVDHATESADALLDADLRGIDSHGVARLSGYLRLLESGRANAKPNIYITRETPSTANIDADLALGLVSGTYAMQVAIQKAKNVGTSWVTVHNSNHFGIAAHHAMKALPHDMIGIAMTNASPLVAPAGSKQRMLGTNPMCFAFPAHNQNPVVVDTATSAAANGKLEIAQRKNKSVPKGWVQTADGENTTDANALKNKGSLLPLGSFEELGYHKGYALGAVVDIFSGVLGGANFGPFVPPFVSFLPVLPNAPGKGIGHIFGVIRVDAFQELDDYYKNMDLWIETFKKSTPINIEKPVLIPGEPEHNNAEYRMLYGIPLHKLVYDDLVEIGEKYDIEGIRKE